MNERYCRAPRATRICRWSGAVLIGAVADV